MLIAQVKLPSAFKRDMFTKLSQEFQCIQEDKSLRIYEAVTYDAGLGKFIDYIAVMNEDEFYIDECEEKDGEYYKDGAKLSNCDVHKRPIDDYVALKNTVVFLDVEKFYSIASNDIRIEIIAAVYIDVPNNFEMCQKFYLAIEGITKRLDAIVNFKFSPDMELR